MKKAALFLSLSLFVSSVVTSMPVAAAQNDVSLDQTADQLEEDATGEEASGETGSEENGTEENQGPVDLANLTFSINQNTTSRMWENAEGVLYYDFDYKEGRELDPGSLLVIEVKENSNTSVLVKDSDYEISYDATAEREKPGTDLEITVTGKGKYTGTKTIHMRIPVICYAEKTKITKIDKNKAYKLNTEELEDRRVDSEKADAIFKNNLNIVVEDLAGESHTLIEGTDYQLEYYMDYTGIMAVIQFQGLYQKSKTDGSSWSLSGWNRVGFPYEKVKVSADKAKIASTMSYNGKTKKPSMTIFTENGVLPEKCYNLSYSNNINPGKANVRVQIKDQYRYMIDIEDTNPLDFTTTFQIEVDKPSDLVVQSVNTTSTSIAWKGTSKALGATYQVQYSTDKKFKKNVITTTTKNTKKKLKQLKKNKTYYVHVRSCVTPSNKTYYSKWSKTKAVKVK